jgi:two-component system, cell cycle sensor histidine kinase and response regulator CckA
MSRKPTYQELEQKVSFLEKKLAGQSILNNTRVLGENISDLIIDSLPGIFYYFDDAGHFLRWNKNFEKVSGYSAEEISDMHPLDFFHDAEKQRVAERIQEAFEKGFSSVEADFVNKNGIATPHYFTGMRLSIGRRHYLTGMGIDMSVRKKAEADLEYYKTAVDEASDAIGMTTPEGRHWYQNKAFDNLFGEIGPDIPTHVYVDEKIGREVFQTIMGGGKWADEVEMYGKEGNILQIFLRAYAVKDGTGNVTSLVGIHTDISGRKQREKELQRTRALLEAAINQSPSGILIADAPDVRIHFANPAAFGIRGGSRERLTEIDVAEHTRRWQTFYPDGRPYDPKDLPLSRAILKGEISRDVEVIIRHESGQERWVSANASPIRDDNGTIQAGIVIFHDITEHVRAKVALQESELKFRTLVEKSPLGVSIIGKDGRFKYCNPRFSEIFGYTIEDVPTGREWFRKAYPEILYREKIIQTWVEDQKQAGVGQIRPRVFTVTCKDGSRKEIYFRPVTMENDDQFVLYEDITEKMKMEQQLYQAQKFEAVATLAGGVAHDFNNLLMGMQGRASLMLTELTPPHPFIEHLNALEEYIRSAAQLTRQMLGFARGGKYEVRPIDINEMVLKSSAMFGRTKKEIRIQTRCPEKPLVVEADQGQIEQVLLNMYVNAWHAMPNGGELYLETKRVMLHEPYCSSHQITPGPYVNVSVSDTGIGMSSDICKRVFDPFFTTKDKARGTGLGLASAYGIVKNHGGIITVYSEIGHGSTFNIYLPLSDKETHHEIISEETVISGSETILLVDDEELIIDVGKAFLEKLGYRVIVARGGAEALEMIKGQTSIDLVILDLIMPGMDGGNTFDRIRELRPDMPVILSSGYALNGQASEILRRGCNGFIQKPFTIYNFSQKIRKALDDRKA